MNTDKLKHREITDVILKSFYEVFNGLGSGFPESVYEHGMKMVLSQDGLDVKTQKDITVFFRKHLVGSFRADLIVDHKVIVELKAAKTLDVSHEAQLLNYLRATDIEVGLLLNFGRKPAFKRFAYDNARKAVVPSQPGIQEEKSGFGLAQINMDKFEITESILKGFYEVYNELGIGFLESVYENAMAIALGQLGLKIETQKDIPVYFRGKTAGTVKVPIVVKDEVMLKISVSKTLDPSDGVQLLNYLKASDIEIGLLLNFGKTPTFKRFVA